MTNNPTTPPPLSPNFRPKQSYGKKIVMMGLICCVLMFGVLAVWGMTFDRKSTNRQVAEEIAQKWGENIYLNGPIILANLSDSAAWQHPQTFVCDASVASKPVHRGIYEAEVFTSHVKMSSVFNRDSLSSLGDTVLVKLKVNTDQIDRPVFLTIDGKRLDWSYAKDYLYATINIADMPVQVECSTEFDIRGTEALYVKPVGERSTVTINGTAGHPSFTGKSLPIDRHLSGHDFTASWMESITDKTTIKKFSNFVGVRFLVGVDRYQKVSRSMKYSFIIIVLTFMSVLFVEIMKKHPIPLLNYFLIGAALIIFYSLLLSFTELTSFGFAYFAASAMTIILITCYIWKMLASRNL